MSKTLVLHRLWEYSLDEVPDIVTYDHLKEIIGDWAEIAIRCQAEHVDKMIGDCGGGPGIVIMCDSNGLAKQLPLTSIRQTDGAPLVGKLVWLSYEDIWASEGPDRIFRPLVENQLNVIVAKLKETGWGEMIFDNTKIAQGGPPPCI